MPQIGVDAVIASSDAVTTHVYCACVPPRSARIRGRALDTIVEDRIATNRAMSRPDSATST